MSDLQELMQKKQSGELTMNQVYLNAFGDGSFKGSFKDFMTKAQSEGWIDQGLNATSAYLNTKYGGDVDEALLKDTPCLDGYEKDANGICIEIKKGMSMGAKIGVGIGIIALIGGIIYIVNKNKK